MAFLALFKFIITCSVLVEFMWRSKRHQFIEDLYLMDLLNGSNSKIECWTSFWKNKVVSPCLYGHHGYTIWWIMVSYRSQIINAISCNELYYCTLSIVCIYFWYAKNILIISLKCRIALPNFRSVNRFKLLLCWCQPCLVCNICR